jgi:hypothetical protein
MSITTVLIVDRDLGFVFWLGQVLTRAGYQALPANSSEAGRELARQLNLGIDILIVGNSLPGAGVFAAALRRSQRHLKVIAVLDDGEEPISAFSGADATQYRPSWMGESSETDWLTTIEGVFARGGATTRSPRSSGAEPS